MPLTALLGTALHKTQVEWIERYLTQQEMPMVVPCPATGGSGDTVDWHHGDSPSSWIHRLLAGWTYWWLLAQGTLHLFWNTLYVIGSFYWLWIDWTPYAGFLTLSIDWTCNMASHISDKESVEGDFVTRPWMELMKAQCHRVAPRARLWSLDACIAG